MVMRNASLLCSLAIAMTLGSAAAMAAPAAPPPDTSPAYVNPGFANPDTPGLLDGKPAPGAANVSDIVFIKSLTFGSRAEVELGKLADSRASAAGVKTFAQRMVKDHNDANGRLASAARAAKVDLPKDLDAEHVAAREELSRLNGRDFDLKYIDSQIKDHQKAVQLLIYEIGNGQSADTRRFAVQTLPAVMEHLEMAKSLHMQLVQ
jgi:putative membrane protein